MVQFFPIILLKYQLHNLYYECDLYTCVFTCHLSSWPPALLTEAGIKHAVACVKHFLCLNKFISRCPVILALKQQLLEVIKIHLIPKKFKLQRNLQRKFSFNADKNMLKKKLIDSWGGGFCSELTAAISQQRTAYEGHLLVWSWVPQSSKKSWVLRSLTVPGGWGEEPAMSPQQGVIWPGS